VPVTNFTSYRTALDNDSFDLILADYSLPTCNGIQALQVARKKCPEVPFVLLSGAIGEHAAIDILRSGATDYVLKSGLERLVPAIQRAVQEASERNQRRHAESDARQSERQYRLIFDGSPVPMWVTHLATGAFLEVNEAAIRHYGYSREEFAGLTTNDIGLPDEAGKLSAYLDDVNARNRPASGTPVCAGTGKRTGRSSTWTSAGPSSSFRIGKRCSPWSMISRNSGAPPKR
jgi:PAS domain-containing protein